MKRWEAFSAPAACASSELRIRVSYSSRRDCGMGLADPGAGAPKSTCKSGSGKLGTGGAGVLSVSLGSLTQVPRSGPRGLLSLKRVAPKDGRSSPGQHASKEGATAYHPETSGPCGQLGGLSATA